MPFVWRPAHLALLRARIYSNTPSVPSRPIKIRLRVADNHVPPQTFVSVQPLTIAHSSRISKIRCMSLTSILMQMTENEALVAGMVVGAAIVFGGRVFLTEWRRSRRSRNVRETASALELRMLRDSIARHPVESHSLPDASRPLTRPGGDPPMRQIP